MALSAEEIVTQLIGLLYRGLGAGLLMAKT